MNDSLPPSANSSPRRSAFGDPSAPRPSVRPKRGWLLWAVAMLLTGLVAIAEFPSELAAWKYAAALEARDAGNKERGYQLLDEVQKRRIDARWYEEIRYRWYKADGKYAEALEILERRGGMGVDFLQERSQLLLHLRRYAEAIKDCERLKQESDATGEPHRLQSLNYLAYARALGKIDLEQAAVDMDAVVEETATEIEAATSELKSQQVAGQSTYWARQNLAVWKSRLPAFLDTRGFVRYQLGQTELAEKDLDTAVKMIEPSVLEQLEEKADRVKAARDPLVIEKELAEPLQTLAVLIYHRGLNRQKLGREDEAEKDFDRIRELIGKEPDDSLF